MLLLLNIIMQAQNERTIKGGFASVDDIHKAMEQYDYEAVIQNLPPMSGDTLFTRLRAQALKSMGRMSETLAEWNFLLPADSTNVKVIMELAECYRQMGNTNKALVCYRKAIEFKPKNKYFRLLRQLLQ